MLFATLPLYWNRITKITFPDFEATFHSSHGHFEYLLGLTRSRSSSERCPSVGNVTVEELCSHLHILDPAVYSYHHQGHRPKAAVAETEHYCSIKMFPWLLSSTPVFSAARSGPSRSHASRQAADWLLTTAWLCSVHSLIFELTLDNT